MLFLLRIKILLLVQLLFLYHPTNTLNTDEPQEILVLGDSWASGSGAFLGSICSYFDIHSETRRLSNDAISGSTAQQWREGEWTKKSFQNGKDYNHVWLSIGGNDFLQSNCNPDLFPTIASDILEVISDILSSTQNPNLQILFTGYGYPTKAVCKNNSSSNTVELFQELNRSIRTAISLSEFNARVYSSVDISNLFVTASSSPYSDKKWYKDTIHINESGYIHLFSMPTIRQDFFGCDPLPVVPSNAPTTSLQNICRKKTKQKDCIKVLGCQWNGIQCKEASSPSSVPILVPSSSSISDENNAVPVATPSRAPVAAPEPSLNLSCSSSKTKNECKTNSSCTWKKNLCVNK